MNFIKKNLLVNSLYIFILAWGYGIANAAIPDDLLRMGESGDASAQTQLGIIYAEGDGTTRNYKKARNWFELAGKQNYADAEYNLGVMYGNGDGVTRDKEKARHWFEKAAVHGNISARYSLGVIYSQDTDTPRDLVRAEFWFIRAAEEGSPEDKYTLGVMYSTGERLLKDDVKARKWFEMAANEGHMLAQYNLAVMYSEGLGGKRSLEKAIGQAEKAAVQGDPEAARLLVALNAYPTGQKRSIVDLLLLASGEDIVQVVPPARLTLSPSDEPPLQPQPIPATVDLEENTTTHVEKTISKVEDTDAIVSPIVEASVTELQLTGSLRNNETDIQNGEPDSQQTVTDTAISIINPTFIVDDKLVNP